MSKASDGLVINDSYLENMCKQIANAETKKYKKVGSAAMKQLRTEATNMWYGRSKTSKDTPMNKALEVKSYSKRQDGKIKITIVSYIVPQIYEREKMKQKEKSIYGSPYNRILSWRERHETTYTYKGRTFQPLNMEYSIGQYLVNLRWNFGHVALPEGSRESQTGWTNKYYQGRTPMKEHVENYVSKNWGERIMSIYEEY